MGITPPTDNARLIAAILPAASGIGWLIAMPDDGLLKIQIVSDLPGDVVTHMSDAGIIEIEKLAKITPGLTRVYKTDKF
jgi:hypothetical protein